MSHSIPAECTLRKIAAKCSEVFAGLPWCIAGGAVRDTLTGTPPKDYDVFVMAPDADVIAAAFALDEGPEGPPEPYLVGNFLIGLLPVQVMAMPHCKSMDDVIDGFDWQISRFAFDGETLLAPGQLPNPGAQLALHRITYAASTWRRGVRFGARFGMSMWEGDAIELTEQSIRDASKNPESTQ